jgi:uncharacterized membrane protein
VRTNHAEIRPVEVAVFALLAVLFVSLKIIQHLGFLTNDFDTGIYSNVAWNIAHGRGFYSSVLERNHLGEHFSPIVAIFAPLYRIHASAIILLASQALAVALTFVVLRKLFAVVLSELPRRTADGISAALLVLFFLYKPAMSALYFEFHPSTLGMPLVACSILFLHRGSDRGLWISVALLLLTKEVAIATTLGLAIYAGAVLGRWRTATALFLVAAGAAALVFQWVMPAFRDGPWGHLERLAPASHPFGKLTYVLGLLVPLGLLPAFGWRALLAAVPTTAVNLSVGLTHQFSLLRHYDDQNCVFWIAAAAHGARVLAPRLLAVEGAWGARLRRGVPVAMLVVALAMTGRTPISQLWRWWPGPARQALRERLAAYVDLPADVAISTQEGLGPHLSHRHHYRMLWAGDFVDPPFEEGELIVLTRYAMRGRLKWKASHRVLASDPRFEVVEKDAYLEVYRWNEDAGASE